MALAVSASSSLTMQTVLKNVSKLSLQRSSAFSSAVAADKAKSKNGSQTVVRKLRPISKAMQAYMDRVKAHEEKMVVESQQFQSGRRFLANMMGEDPTTFHQAKIDEAIRYLLPSGLYEKAARPIMKPPEELFPALKSAAFDETGKPFHYLYYTKFVQAYEIQHEATRHIKLLNNLEDELHLKKREAQIEDQLDVVGTKWLDCKSLEKKVNDNIPQDLYNNTIDVLQVLLNHPMSSHAKDFIMEYRKPIENVVAKLDIPPPLEGADGRLYVESKGVRNRSSAKVVVRSPGTGKILINKLHDITYFSDLQARQQILFPMQVAGLLNKVDLEAQVHGGGPTGESGAIRYATALALRCFVDKDTLIKLQIAGLLTFERRHKERKKPGKAGARRGYTWLKR